MRSRLEIARIGDNMREVAVTEGDKVAAQIELGYSVNGYGIGDLVRYVDGGDRQRDRAAVCGVRRAVHDGSRLRPGGERRAALR